MSTPEGLRLTVFRGFRPTYQWHTDCLVFSHGNPLHLPLLRRWLRRLNQNRKRPNNRRPRRSESPGQLRPPLHKFAEIIKHHGPDAVAFYISGLPLTKDDYVFNEATLSPRVYQ